MEEYWVSRYRKIVDTEPEVARDTSINEMTDEKWITFIGHGRSGHTIVSAILDSHPNVRISEEQKYIKRWHTQGWTKDRILKHLLESGQGKERRHKALPGSGAWVDGKHKRLAVGDKWGYDAVGLLRVGKADADILDQFSKYMGMKLKVIHTIRDPHDNICAWLDSPKYQRQWGLGNELYRMSIRQYARFYGTAFKLLTKYDHFNLYNDKLIMEPRETLTALCEYLELPVVEPWLTNAVNSVFKKPNIRSANREWPPKWLANIDERIITKYDFMERYKR